MRNESDDARLLDERTAAERLNISPRLLFTLRKRDKAPHIRVGSRVLYDLEELVRWMKVRSGFTN